MSRFDINLDVAGYGSVVLDGTDISGIVTEIRLRARTGKPTVVELETYLPFKFTGEGELVLELPLPAQREMTRHPKEFALALRRLADGFDPQ